MTSAWLLIGSGFIGLGLAGGHSRFSTLPLSVCVTLVALALDVARRRPRNMRLIDVWCFAFVYLFGSDTIASLAGVREDFGLELASAAEGFIVAAFGATLVGYAGTGLFVTSRRMLGQPGRPRARAREMSALIALSTVILGYIVIAVSPSDLMILRSARRGTGVEGPAFVAVVAAMIVQAALTARAMAARRRPAILAFPVMVAALSFVVLYGVGTRYFLGFFGGAVLYFAARFNRPLSSRRLATFAVGVLALAAAQGTMRLLRGTGIGAVEAGSVLSALAQPQTYASSEGMLRVHAWVHERAIFEAEGRAPEHAFLLYWWVPRSFWPSKPTMDGYWLAHEVMADGDVGSGHNVAGGFLLPALLDFGPNVGIAVCFLYGFGLWAADRFIARHGDPTDQASGFAALLPFAVFFAMRSPQTSALFLESCIVVYLPIFLLVRGRQRARRRMTSAEAEVRQRSCAAGPVSVPVAVRSEITRRWRR